MRANELFGHICGIYCRTINVSHSKLNERKFECRACVVTALVSSVHNDLRLASAQFI